MPGNTISDPGFQTTRWSLVAALDQHDDTPAHPLSGARARQRLLELCLRYWYPVYLYLRRSGHGAEAAQALAANFFATLLQRRGSGASRGHDGRFRTFLLSELHRFLAESTLNERGSIVATTSLGPDLPIPPLAQLEARRQREGDAGGSPELALRRGFALEVIAEAMRRIEDEAREAGRLPMFSALQPYLACDPAPGIYADIAQRLDVSPLFLTLALKRLRERFRELVDDELAQTVASADALDDERRCLHAALQSAA